MVNRAIIGDTPRRREDARFTTGQGAYLDDLRFDGLAHAVVLRSPHAHARIGRIDATAARAMPGVLAVLTSEDARADGLQPMRPTVEANVQTGEPFAFAPQPLLATGKVRHVGEPVALIVAETRAQALDAAERVAIDWIRRCRRSPPPPLRARQARRRSPTKCRAMSAWTGTGAMRAAVDAAFAAAAHVVSLRLDNHRIVTNPMEPRGAVGSYDAARGRYTLFVSSQNIHGNRDATARALGVPPADVRFIAPDVGGGFGAKNFTYAEHALILWAAKRVGRPVKWIATRSEGFVSDHQARDHQAEASLALDADGQVPRAARRQRGEYRRLHGRRRRRGADQPVRASARQHLRNSRHRTARRDGAEQHHADRRDARPRLCRGGEHHRAADRRSGTAMRLRSRGPAPPQHGAGRGDADDQCAGLLGGQRQFRADLRPCAGGGRRGRFRRAPRRQRGARTAARTRLRLPHQGHRRLAARERRYPLRAGRHGVADHRHADHRPGPRDDVPADPRRPARHSERGRSGCARATPT